MVKSISAQNVVSLRVLIVLLLRLGEVERARVFLDPDGYMPHGEIVAICVCYIVACIRAGLSACFTQTVFLNKSKALFW